MSDITQRFLELYDYLLATNEVAGKGDFATKIGISTSSFTEISKGRNNVGLPAIQKTVQVYDWVNVEWLLKGSGSLDSRVSENNNTPDTKLKKTLNSLDKGATNAPATNNNFAPANAPATTKLWLPKVVVVNEDERELISLVPVKAAAGYLNGYGDAEYVESLPTIRMPNLGNGSHRAFEIKGHSMNPTLYNGSMSIGRWVESFTEIRDRRIYIVVTKTEGIVAKRVLNRIEESGKLILVSDNQNKKEYPNILLDVEDVLEIWYQRANLSFEFPEPDVIYNRVNDLEARMTLFEDQIKRLVK